MASYTACGEALFIMKYWKNLSLENISEIVDDTLVVEEWRDIIGYEGHYHVSNFGRIKSIARNLISKYAVIRKWKERIIRQCICKRDGYLKITISKNGINTSYQVHRLVGIAFVDNHQNKRTVNHKWGDKTDNRAGSLEWHTYSENNQHAYDFLNKRASLGERKGKHSKYSVPVIQLSLEGDFIQEWDSIGEAARGCNIHRAQVSMVCLHTRKKTHNFIFLYKSEYIKANIHLPATAQV